jgi:hypothetical protein
LAQNNEMIFFFSELSLFLWNVENTNSAKIPNFKVTNSGLKTKVNNSNVKVDNSNVVCYSCSDWTKTNLREN